MKAFLTTALGHVLTYIICYAIGFGLVASAIKLTEVIGSPVAILIVLVGLAIYGWRSINWLTRDLFIWIPLAGLPTYFIVKFFISAMLGIFVVPHYFAKKILGGE